MKDSQFYAIMIKLGLILCFVAPSPYWQPFAVGVACYLVGFIAAWRREP